MKKILATALAIVLFVGASQAQTTKDKGLHQDGQRKEHAFNQLNLTAEQKAKFKSIREAQKTEMEALRKAGTVTPEQRKALHEKYSAQFQAVLTPAQQEQFKQQRKEWKEKGAMGRGAGKQVAFFKKELDLSADQESKLKSIFQEFRTKSQDIRSNTSLTKEQKKEQMQSLAKQYMEQGKAVLSPEQLQKFNELKGRHRGRKSDNV